MELRFLGERRGHRPWQTEAATAGALGAILCSILAAWACTVVLAGRSLPWQATSEWLSVFGLLLAVSCARLWRFLRSTGTQRVPNGRKAATTWGLVPILVVSIAFLVPSYLSDGFYTLLLQPSSRLRVIAIAGAVALLLETLLGAFSLWAGSESTTFVAAMRSAALRRGEVVVLAGLVAIGVLQGAARSSPIGDDLGQYIEVAQALLAGAPYPIHQSPDYYVAVGMTPDNPGMPGLSVLLYLSFLLFGPTLSGVAVVLSALEAIFPLAMYLACRSLTGSRPFAFGATIVLFLFPVYQLHVLGGPEPDTLFADLLLLCVILAAKATRTPRWPYWAALGFTAGLLANTRHEGLSFSLGILLVFSLFSQPKRLLPALVLAYLVTLVPFSLTYLSVAGSIWPSSFGGTLSPGNVGANLVLLKEIVLPWHLQAVGLDATGLAVLGAGIALSAAAGLVFLWNTNRALLFVPCLGGGYLCSSLLIHPLILNPYSPVDIFRHWSSAIPYLWLSAMCGLYWGYQTVAHRLPGRLGVALALAGAVLAGGLVSYEADRLAHPEWYLGGRWSLLWTGGSYPLADVMREPIRIPPRGDTRSGEELRAEQDASLERYNLRNTNASEPYHWAAFILALSVLLYAALPAALDSGGRAPLRRSAPVP